MVGCHTQLPGLVVGCGHGDGGCGGRPQPGGGGRGPGWPGRPLTRVSGAAAEGPAPDDRYHAIYFAMLLAGVGFLLPYNSFITDVDYLHHKFPGGSLRAPRSHAALGGCPAPRGSPAGRAPLREPAPPTSGLSSPP